MTNSYPHLGTAPYLHRNTSLRPELQLAHQDLYRTIADLVVARADTPGLFIFVFLVENRVLRYECFPMSAFRKPFFSFLFSFLFTVWRTTALEFELF